MALHLLDWYKDNGRDFPWRKEAANSYEKICVEILLQQTRAETVSAYYDVFFKKYPSWQSITESTEGELQETLKPLGIWNRRAKSLRQLSNHVISIDENFPRAEKELLEIPAVGLYVSNAIKLFYHHEKAPLLDSNMARVIERNLGKRKLADIRYDPWLREASDYLVGCEDFIKINWAVLDLAATTCKPRKPSCNTCPLIQSCGQHF